VEHVAGVRCRVVVSRGTRGDPLDALGWVVAVAVGGPAAEDAERDAVVAVGLLVVVGAVDPADDFLGCIAVLECVGEAADVLGYPGAVAEELEVPVVAVLGLEEIEFVAEVQQGVSVGGGDLLGFLDPLSQRLDLRAGIAYGSICVFIYFKYWDVNFKLEVWPKL
jgi:hypothetical protein